MTEVLSAGRTSGSLNTQYQTPASSFGRLILDRTAASGPREAFRSPTADGGWRSYTWNQITEESSEAAAGLVALGVEVEDRVAIASGTRLEWILADFAIMLAGAATTTVYPSTGPEDVAYILGDSDTVVLIAEDQSQVDKVIEQKINLPGVRQVVLIDGEGDGDFVLSWDQLRQKGRALLAEKPGLIEERVSATGPDNLATLIYTSGTTGKPKGVELTHGNWTYEGAAIASIGILREDDVQFLWLPLAHSFGKVLLAGQLQAGFMTVVDGRIPKIVENLPVIKPTFMAAVPRIFEKVYAGVAKQATSESKAKAAIFEWACRVGKRAFEQKLEGKPVKGLLAVQYGLADKLVFSKIKARMGGNIRYFVSGSAALSKDINAWFGAAGMTILEGYGLTETSAGTSIVRPEHLMPGTIGEPMPGTEMKIAEDGEILIRGPGVMRGYRNRPQDNKEAFVYEGGWFSTGDIGVIDDLGRVKMTDRKKDLVKTSGGKYIAPGAIEAQFKALCPLAGAMVVIANERNFASALVALDPDAAKAWGQSHGLDGSDPAAIADNADLRAEIQAALDALNANLNRWETIKKFVVLPRELTVESGELTPSLKVKRKVVEQTFSDLVEGMYAG
ncbi:MAG: long-chain fatty acid--CoA ligase [Candidatus Nanopelagicales bacterium]|nr:long-chain fatty acid--CoA ligase [Candidatus Nanopelagicales bacterium]